MAKFSKRHYEIIAKAIKDTNTKSDLTAVLIREFAVDNPLFDAERFTKACGYNATD